MTTRLKIILLASLFIVIGFFGYYLYGSKTFDAWADSDAVDLSPLRGWGWADDAGWISYNCRTGGPAGADICATSPYIVSANPTCSGNICPLQGHAWSDTIGWITFDTAVYGNNCPSPGPCTATCGACFNTVTKKIEGWAKALSLKNPGDPEINSYGWIQLSNVGNNPGVSVEPSNGNIAQDDWGDLFGWAWNGYDDNSGLGWFSFNCLDNPTGCSGKSYKVTGQPIKPAVTNVVPTPGQESNSINITWTSVYGATQYEVLRQDYVCSGDVTHNCTKNFDNTCPSMGTCVLSPNINSKVVLSGRGTVNYTDMDNVDTFSTYKYRVRALNLFGGIASDPYADYSVSPILMDNLSVTGICKAPKSGANDRIYVDLSWKSHIYFNAGDIESYEIEYCTTKTGAIAGDCGFTALASFPDPATDPVKYRHVIDAAADPGLFADLRSAKFITYRIRGVGRDYVCVDGTNDNVPCNTPGLPCAGGGTCNAVETCQGGVNDGKKCTADAECLGVVCDPSRSTWKMTEPKQICPRGSDYIEVRVED